MTMPTLDETIAFIKEAHKGQRTKGGDPYWTHPVAVMNLIPDDATDDERHAALLHDVIEDCGYTKGALLRAGYSERTVWLVEKLSRPEGRDRPTYSQWIRSIAESRDKGLIRIKLADNQHNSDPERIAKLPENERGIVERYNRSMPVLRLALAELELQESTSL